MAAVSKLKPLPQATRDALVADILTGRKMRSEVAKFYQTSEGSVRRMLEEYSEEDRLRIMAKEAEKAKIAEAEAHADAVMGFGEDVSSDMKFVLRKLKGLLEDAEGDEDRLMQLGSLKEMRQTLMSLAEIHGQISKKIEVTMDLKNSPAFLELKTVVLEVLENHPAAKDDFLSRIAQMKLINAPSSS